MGSSWRLIILVVVVAELARSSRCSRDTDLKDDVTTSSQEAPAASRFSPPPSSPLPTPSDLPPWESCILRLPQLVTMLAPPRTVTWLNGSETAEGVVRGDVAPIVLAHRKQCGFRRLGIEGVRALMASLMTSDGEGRSDISIPNASSSFSSSTSSSSPRPAVATPPVFGWVGDSTALRSYMVGVNALLYPGQPEIATPHVAKTGVSFCYDDIAKKGLPLPLTRVKLCFYRLFFAFTADVDLRRVFEEHRAEWLSGVDTFIVITFGTWDMNWKMNKDRKTQPPTNEVRFGDFASAKTYWSKYIRRMFLILGEYLQELNAMPPSQTTTTRRGRPYVFFREQYIPNCDANRFSHPAKLFKQCVPFLRPVLVPLYRRVLEPLAWALNVPVISVDSLFGHPQAAEMVLRTFGVDKGVERGSVDEPLGGYPAVDLRDNDADAADREIAKPVVMTSTSTATPSATAATSVMSNGSTTKAPVSPYFDVGDGIHVFREGNLQEIEVFYNIYSLLRRRRVAQGFGTGHAAIEAARRVGALEHIPAGLAGITGKHLPQPAIMLPSSAVFLNRSVYYRWRREFGVILNQQMKRKEGEVGRGEEEHQEDASAEDRRAPTVTQPRTASAATFQPGSLALTPPPRDSADGRYHASTAGPTGVSEVPARDGVVEEQRHGRRRWLGAASTRSTESLWILVVTVVFISGMRLLAWQRIGQATAGVP